MLFNHTKCFVTVGRYLGQLSKKSRANLKLDSGSTAANGDVNTRNHILLSSMLETKAKEALGTTRFDLLAEYITSPPILHALQQIGCKEITFQIGGSDIDPGEYEKEGIKLHLYRFKDSIQKDIIEADLVISHAGAGSCLEALDANKPLLVVVNEDLMDNHQLELAEQLQVDGHLYYCTCDTLESTLGAVDFSLLTPFPKPNTSLFVKYLDDVLKVKNSIE